MAIPTEPIGSIPRSANLLAAMSAHAAGRISRTELHAVEEHALRDTIARFEETGSPVITDGEQTKPSFATYPLAGLKNLAADGVVIPFADGHTRQLPRLTAGPFRYGVHAVTYLKATQGCTLRPLKQAVISASALSLLYPQSGPPGYAREAFVEDLAMEAERDIRLIGRGGPSGSVSAFLGSPSQSPMRSLRLSLLQVIEVALDHPDLGLLGLSKCHVYFAGLP